MTDQELAEIESRANAATPGPWATNPTYVLQQETDFLVCQIAPGAGGDNEPFFQWLDNAEFISHARADVPALVAEVRRLRAEAARTVLEGLSVQALVAEIERLKSEAAKNRLVFVWELGEQNQTFVDLSADLVIFAVLDVEDIRIELVDADTGAEIWSWGLSVPTFDAAEELIRKLGFARTVDVFDRSKVSQ